MARLSMGTKNTAKKLIDSHPLKTENKAGGVAFSIKDPAQYLLSTIGSSMFVEPKYYDDEPDLENLKVAGFKTEGLDEQAVRIVNACIEVSQGSNPRDVLALAHWARREMNIRTTPCVMVAAAAKCEGTKGFVREYVPKVARRPDDILQIVAAYEHLFGAKGFPASLKKGVALAISQVNEYGFLKYNKDGHPNWKDLLLFVDRKKDYPVSQPVFEYLVNDKLVDPKATPVFAARKNLSQLSEWSAEASKLARLSQVTWEVLVSQFGSTPEVWSAVIPRMGYMARLRNLVNFIKVGIPASVMRKVAKTLTDPDLVKDSKQMPFRFLAAHDALLGADFSGTQTAKLHHELVQIAVSAVSEALDVSASNLPRLPGRTCIVADISGSMAKPLSSNSSMRHLDAAVALAALAFKAASNRPEDYALCGSFGTCPVFPILPSSINTLQAMKVLRDADTRGWGTEAWKVVRYLIDQNLKMDRIIILSDMMCYSTGPDNVAGELLRYRRSISPGCFFHTVNLDSQDATTIAPINELTFSYSGFHPAIFGHFLVNEQGTQVVSDKSDPVQQSLPSLQYIRDNF